MKRRKILLVLLTLIVLGGGIAYWKLTRPPAPIDGTAEATPARAEARDKSDGEGEQARRRLLGVWQDDYKGKRTMTLNEDGSATMLVELTGAQAFLFASKLRFDMKWSLQGKKLTKQTVGGEPADKVNLILNTMGNTATDTILELTDDRLLLLDADGTTKYDWRRVNPGRGASPP